MMAGTNWVRPDTKRRSLKAVNAFLAGLFFDLLSLHNMKRFVQTAAWLFAVLLALQNFQNLQSAYDQKNACLATTSFSSGGSSSASSASQRRGFTAAVNTPMESEPVSLSPNTRSTRQAAASPAAPPAASTAPEASPAASADASPAPATSPAPADASPAPATSPIPAASPAPVHPSAYVADVRDMSNQVDDLVTALIVFLALLAVAASITLFRPVWRNFKLVYHRKVPRLHRGEPMDKLWRLLAKTALSALYGAGFLVFLAGFLVFADYIYQAHESVLTSTVACPSDPGSFSWIWLAVIVPLAVLYCILPLTSAWVNPLKRHLFRRNRLYWIADQPIYIRNGAINFNRRDADERDPKIVTYDDYITNLKEALIRKDASLDEINTIRERMNVVLESLAGCLSERIMENDDRPHDASEPRLSYLASMGRGKFRRRDSIDSELDEYPTFRSASASMKSMKR